MPEINMRPKSSLMDRLYLGVWDISINADRCKIFPQICYAWTLIRLFRVYQLFKRWQLGKTIIQHHYDTFLEAAESMSKEPEATEKKTIVKADRAQLMQQSSSLFQLEVSLICSTECRKEVYSLLAHDHVSINDVSDRIYYKAYYQASRFHGQIQLELVRQCNKFISDTHATIRETLKRMEKSISFHHNVSQLSRISANLNLRPVDDEKCTKGKHWEDVGFQGDDPTTDFRGVGELGLHHLDYFCEHHPLYALRMIEESGTLSSRADVEQPWYPFALCGIHVTKYVCGLLQGGRLQRHLLQAQLQGEDGVTTFLDVFFSYCFIQCHLDWAEGVDKKEITSVFQFEQFFAEFTEYFTKQLTERVWNNDDFYPQQRWW